MSLFLLLRPLFDAGSYVFKEPAHRLYFEWNRETKTYETKQEKTESQTHVQDRERQRDRPTFTNIVRSTEGKERLAALDQFLDRLNSYAAQINQAELEKMRQQLLLERKALLEHLKILEDDELLLTLLT